MYRAVFSALFILLILSCGKDNDELLTASIEGYDLRLCACCGGLLVKPENTEGDVYQWYQKNNAFGIDGNSKFPLKVKIKYHHLAQTCVASDGEIEITVLEIVK